jgi:hypothetical protein
MLTNALADLGLREEGGGGRNGRPAVLFLQAAPSRSGVAQRKTPGALPGVSSGRDMGFDVCG